MSQYIDFSNSIKQFISDLKTNSIRLVPEINDNWFNEYDLDLAIKAFDNKLTENDKKNKESYICSLIYKIFMEYINFYPIDISNNKKYSIVEKLSKESNIDSLFTILRENINQ